LLAEYRRWIRDHLAGNQDIYDQTIGYISEEQRLGRIQAECDPSIIAEMLLGPCFRRVFRQSFMDSKSPRSDEKFLADLVQTLALVLAARSASKERSVR
jgi:hypothetical protein